MDRYAYVNNSPVNYIDPYGHVPVDCFETGYCGSNNSNLLFNGKRGIPGLTKVGVGLRNYAETPSYDGTLYFSGGALTVSVLNQSKLSSKAENSYSDFGGVKLNPIINNPNAYSIDFLNNTASLASDFSPPQLDLKPIYLEMNWSESEGDLLIHNIEINNQSNTVVAIDNIILSSSEAIPSNNILFGDPNNYAGFNDSLSMNVGSLIVDHTYIVTINLDIHGGFPANQSLTINLHPDYMPQGCYQIPLK